MSRIYFKPFTFKKAISSVFLGLNCFIFNNIAYSAEASKIVGHYYISQDPTNTKYNDKIQWEITSLPEWSKFMETVKTLPKDAEKNNPMGLRQPEIIHFNVVNSDQKSGHDIFISQAGIQQFSKMPMDIYYSPSSAFKEFLETELSLNPGYDTTSGKININAPGIVVIYHGSSQLKNPHWNITLAEDKVLERYKEFINNLQPMGGTETASVVVEDDNIYENQGTFQLYLNYPNAPQEILVVGTNNSVRGTKIQQQYSYYKDEVGYFSMFKRQAEDNMKASKMTEDAPDERRKREAARGALF